MKCKYRISVVSLLSGCDCPCPIWAVASLAPSRAPHIWWVARCPAAAPRHTRRGKYYPKTWNLKPGPRILCLFYYFLVCPQTRGKSWKSAYWINLSFFVGYGNLWNQEQFKLEARTNGKWKSLCFLDQRTLQEWKIVNYHFRDTFHDVVIQKEISFDSGLPALSNSLISMVMDQNIFYYLVEYSAFSSSSQLVRTWRKMLP